MPRDAKLGLVVGVTTVLVVAVVFFRKPAEAVKPETPAAKAAPTAPPSLLPMRAARS